MSTSIRRRQFLKSGLFLTSGALGGLLNQPFDACAQVSSPLNFALTDHPLLMLVSIFESLASYFSSQANKAKMNDIADQLTNIAGQQDRILQQLASLRIMMDEAVKQGFLDNDVRELHAVSQHFRVALVSDHGTRDTELHGIVGRMGELASKIADFGLPAVPAYLTAITLENGANYVLGSSPEIFTKINEFHHQNLDKLLNGEGPTTLSHFAKYPLNPLAPEGSSIGAQALLTGFGRRYAFALVSKKYEISDYTKPEPASTFETGYSYEGFRNGQPVFEDFASKAMYGKYQGVPGYSSDVKGKKVTSANIWFGAINESGINQSAIDYGNIPGLLHKPLYEADLDVDAHGVPTLNEDGSNILQGQLKALKDYYLKSYDPGMGDITRETVQKTRESQDQMRQLLSRGLSYVDRILAVKRNDPAAVFQPS